MKILTETIDNRLSENGMDLLSEAVVFCTRTELDILIKSLSAFRREIEDYCKTETKPTGYSHIHFNDCCPQNKNESDLVFYVDLEQ